MQNHDGRRGPNKQMDREIRLAESLNKLHVLRQNALSGRRYDPDEFDRAVLEFRRAWVEARVGENDADAGEQMQMRVA